MGRELDDVVAMIRAAGMADGNRSVQERRALLEAVVTPPAPDLTVEVVSAAGVPCERVATEGADPARVVMHLHGGGYTSGSVGTHRTFAGALTRATGATVLMVDYRLAPEHPFPAALDDARAAFGWLTGDGGVDPTSVVVSGDSAGGGLAAALLVAQRDDGGALPAGAVLLSPWTDLAMTGASYDSEDGRDPMCSRASLGPSAAAYLDGQDATLPLASPVYTDLAGLPPLLIHVGEVETLRDDAVALADRATAAGTQVELWVAPGMVHVWHMFAGMVPESDRALAVVADWITARLDAP